MIVLENGDRRLRGLSWRRLTHRAGLCNSPLRFSCVAPASSAGRSTVLWRSEPRSLGTRTVSAVGFGLAVLFVIGMFSVFPAIGSSADAAVEATSSEGWGEIKDGLRIRVIPTLAKMSEDAIDPSKRVAKFETPDDVALIVEFENVSDKPIIIAETRYGENYGPSKGKANSDWLGQFLFAIDYLDQKGTPIERPDVQLVGPISPVDGTLASTLVPQQKLRMLLRPAKWVSVFSERPRVGRQRAVVTYLGVKADVKQSLQKFQKQSALLSAIEGNVVAPAVEFEVIQEPNRKGANQSPVAERDAKPPVSNTPSPQPDAEPLARDLSRFAWGPTSQGLRAAVEIVPVAGLQELSQGTKPNIQLHVQNVGQQVVNLATHLWLSELPLTVKNAKDEAVEVGGTWYSGMTPVVRVTLKPQQMVTFNSGNLGLAITKARAEKFEHVTNRTLVAPSGQYSLQATERFGLNFRMQDGEGKVLVPTETDWKGELKSGIVNFQIAKESIECHLVDAITGQPVNGATTTFRFIRPKTAANDEETVAVVVAAKRSDHIVLTIPDTVLQRADREELEVRWNVGQHPDYELLSPQERIPLKPFFTEGPQSLRNVFKMVKLTPKKK